MYSRATEPRDQEDSLPLQFLTFSHPSQAKTRNLRKTVRSHVTNLQHQKVRLSRFARLDTPGSEHAASEREGAELDGFVPNPPFPTAQNSPSPVVDVTSAQVDSIPDNLPPSASPEDEVDVAATPGLTQQVATSRVNPFTTYDPASDWTVDVPSLIDQYLDRARIHITSQGMPRLARALDSRMIKPRLYLDGFLFNVLLTLTTTSVPVANEQRRHESMVTWLRTNLLIIIRAALDTGSYDPKALAIGIALLIGWELEIGDPSACRVHLNALPTIMKTISSPKRRDNPFAYRGREVGSRAFRGGRTIPSGFEFYRSQNLLPSSLMFHVGSLVYWDASAPGASCWMRELWSSIGACAPVEIKAQTAVAHGTVDARIAQLVRQAAIMLGSLMRSSAGERPVAQPQVTGIQAQWHSMLATDWDSLTGTVFDEILLWCMCVFCTTSGYHNDQQLKGISRLLARLDIRTLDDLSALLATFLWPPCVHLPLRDLCSHMHRLLPPSWAMPEGG